MESLLNNGELNPPVNDVELENFSKKFNLDIPPQLNDLLKEFNGGVFPGRILRNRAGTPWIAYGMDENYLNISHILSLNEIESMIDSITDHCNDYQIDIENERFFLKSMVPFTTVDSVNPVCICCKGENLGKIFLIEWYFHHQNEFILPFPCQFVANSLDEFLDFLVLEAKDNTYQDLIKL